ncbi:uncharacterized protein LOC120109973 [Phoenix dactylifera]|uniref:Uncharacterized protein LOC120109973 n=1 Tax=Phoenix dactylifera TaxID=42345 RepID=A0A8B9A7J3_PHODC|nr:uncharacterized protein LOC120109973 [Phoenix dactylifera]
MQYLASLNKLSIKDCARLQIMAEDLLSSMPDEVEIVDCPGLSNWCQIQRINCIEVASGNKLTTSNTWENVMHEFDDLTSVEHLYFGNHWRFFLRRDSIPILEELTIWGCTDIPPLFSLPRLTSLRSLVIKDCPRIHCLPSYLLPSTLKSLVVDNCEDLTFLRLAQENLDAFEELQLMNCPKLERVEGVNCLFFTKILRIERCLNSSFHKMIDSHLFLQMSKLQVAILAFWLIAKLIIVLAPTALFLYLSLQRK